MNTEQRGSWYLLTGLLLGIGLGLFYAWGLAPAPESQSSPAALRADFKNEYRYMIAAAYAANPDLVRARARLNLLNEEEPARELGAQAQQMLAQNAPEEAVRIVAQLAEDMQRAPSADTLATAQSTRTSPPTIFATNVTEITPSQEANTPPSATPTAIIPPTSTPQPQATPLMSVTPRPSRTPSPTPGKPYALASQTSFCDPQQPALLQVFIRNGDNKPIPGVEVIISWAGGEENIFTGFKPDIDFGYADFKMNENNEYALSMSNGATRVSGLRTSACTAPDGTSYFGGIRLEFRQP